MTEFTTIQIENASTAACSRQVVLRFLGFLRSLFWFLLPWLVLVAGAIILIPLDTKMPGASHQGPLPPLTSTDLALRANLRRHVEELAIQIGERNLHRRGALQAATRYVETEFQAKKAT